MKTVLLAGGRGTRLSEETSVRPKPMVEIGGTPIIEHVMSIYARFGHADFVVACGYLGHVIKNHFATYRSRMGDFTVDLSDGAMEFRGKAHAPWRVTLIDTGLDTMTGGRLARLRDLLEGETFMMTYGDGLANVDINALITAHREAGRYATVTAVMPPARFGSLVINDNAQVTAFEEKVRSSEARINGGFFVLEPEVFEFLEGDDVPFEQGPMRRLAAEGHVTAFHHDGFWKPMDTLRDKLEFEAHVTDAPPPWLK